MIKKAVFCLLLILLFFSVPLLIDEKHEKDFPEAVEEEIEEEAPIYTLLFVGDMMLDRGVRYMVEKHGEGDYTFPFLKIEDTLKKADLLFGNLESVISDKGRDVGGIYSFRADPLAMEGLVFAGFDIVSLANNHAFDYGRAALEDTMERLKKAGIKYTGAGFGKNEAHSPAVIVLGETAVGFLGYTEFLYPYAEAQEERAGVTRFSMEILEEDIETAKKEVDFLVVTFHYGVEYAKKPSARQVELSERAIDFGADLVIGHHPHVTQPVEEYKGKYIAYSLGNFVFDQHFSKETMSGFILKIKIREKEVVDMEKIDYKLNEHYQPYIDIEAK